jgi:hypothetical protein
MHKMHIFHHEHIFLPLKACYLQVNCIDIFLPLKVCYLRVNRIQAGVAGLQLESARGLEEQVVRGFLHRFIVQLRLRLLRIRAPFRLPRRNIKVRHPPQASRTLSGRMYLQPRHPGTSLWLNKKMNQTKKNNGIVPAGTIFYSFVKYQAENPPNLSLYLLWKIKI